MQTENERPQGTPKQNKKKAYPKPESEQNKCRLEIYAAASAVAAAAAPRVGHLGLAAPGRVFGLRLVCGIPFRT